jgi:uncharacterized OsmC-like protein
MKTMMQPRLAMQAAPAMAAAPQTTNITNGVDVHKLHETVAAVKQNAELASFQFRIQNRWIDCGENRSHVLPFSAGGKVFAHRVGFTLTADEPEMLLGADTGANPVEHLLHALASCVTTSTVYHAAARGIKIERIESTLEGDLDLRGFLDLDPTVRKGYQNIRISLQIKAPNATEEQLRELSALGQRYSPVYDTLSKGVKVAITTDPIE